MLARLRALCRAWRHRATVERDTHDELRFHVESRADDLVRRGLAPEQAARQARLEFGNPSGYRDQCRDARGLRLVDDFAADVRFALRGFRRHKALSAIVVVTLTFGIGVSSGVFTLYSAITLRPMVDTDPETFLRLFATSAADRSQLKPYSQLSVEEYVAFRDGSRSVRALSAQSPVAFGLMAGIGLALLTAVAFALLHELRFAVSPRDPVTYAGITLLLLAIITLALWPPARRAAAINPLVALRCE